MKVVWALDTFPDSPVPVQVGEAWAADDPLVTGRPGSFTAVVELPADAVVVHRSTDDPGLSFRQVLGGEETAVPEDVPPVEQATRGPGEQRATRRLRPVKPTDSRVAVADAERDALTAEAKALDVEVDDRWPLATLRERVEAARPASG